MTASSGSRSIESLSITEARERRRIVSSATIGNLLESYDFAVYGYFAAILSPLFFPTDDPTSSVLLAVATFGVGFVARPIGAVVLGAFADKHGRKNTLTLTISLMAIGTAVIGFVPTYATIGIAAPLILVFARLLQGFSAGGEIGSATAFLVEHAPPGRRGFYGSFQQLSQGMALLAGSAVGAALTGLLDTAQLQSWGWRIPFFLGLIIGPVGLYIRSRTSESEAFVNSERPTSPVAEVFRQHRLALLAGFGITITWTVCVYFFLVYMPTFANRELKIPPPAAFIANALGLVVIIALAPVFGKLSDRVGRFRLLALSAALLTFVTYPALVTMQAVPSVEFLILVQVLIGAVIACFTGVAPAAIAELCPPNVRGTSFSISYNFAVVVFGGFAPFISTWLIAVTGQSTSPAYYATFAFVVSSVLMMTAYRRALSRNPEPA